MEQTLDIKIKPLSLLKFAFPTMIANLFMSIYATVDGIFVANYVNANALSPISTISDGIVTVVAALFNDKRSLFVVFSIKKLPPASVLKYGWSAFKLILTLFTSVPFPLIPASNKVIVFGK